jgi:hypothetical protein
MLAHKLPKKKPANESPVNFKKRFLGLVYPPGE